jgi:hypothetical protein
MNFPDNKEDKNKILLLMGIVLLAVGFGIYSFGISPYFKNRKAMRIESEDLSDKLWQARKDIRNLSRNIDRNTELVDQILKVSEEDRYILRPNLGNYLLVASDILNSQAEALGLTIESINETMRITITPEELKKRDANGPRFTPYAINVTLSCGMHDLVRLVQQLEDNNPYMCITRLGVLNQDDSAEIHSVSFDVQWPVWIDNAHPVQLAAERLSDKERR